MARTKQNKEKQVLTTANRSLMSKPLDGAQHAKKPERPMECGGSGSKAREGTEPWLV